jgi:hypothetical protein
MNKRIFALALSVLLYIIYTPTIFAQIDFCGISNTSFSKNEKLAFKVYYNMGSIWVAAGEASFTTKITQVNGKAAYHITGFGKTLKSYEWFFKVRDTYQTFIDTQTLQPLKFIRDVKEGSYSKYEHATFDYATNKIITPKGVLHLPKCTQDVLSAIYYARNIDYTQLKVGDKIPFKMYLDDQVYELYIKYLGKAQVKTKYGIFKAIKLSPLLIEGTLFKGGDKMVVWVTDDKNKLPIRIESPIVVGSIKVDLMAFDNIKHPLDALIKTKKG